MAARPTAALRVRKFRVHWFDFRSGAQCARGEITEAALPTWRRVRSGRCACGSSPCVGSTSVWARSVPGGNNRSGAANVPSVWALSCVFQMSAQCAEVKLPRPKLPTWRRARKRRCACGSFAFIGSTSVWARSEPGENKTEAHNANAAARPRAALRVRKFRAHWCVVCMSAERAGVKEPRPRRQRGGASESGAARAAVSRSLVRLPFGCAVCRGQITEAILRTWRRARKRRCACGSFALIGVSSV